MLQENQEDLLEDQRALQLRVEDAVPGDGHGSDNESSPEFNSDCNGESVSTNSDDVVVRLISTASSESQEQKDRLENEVWERKEANQALQGLLEKSDLFSDSFHILECYHVAKKTNETLIIYSFFLSLVLSFSCGISAYGRGDIADHDLPANAVCDDSSTCLSVPAHRHFNARVATYVLLEPSLVDEVPQGIDVGFLARHSQDRGLLESLGVDVESPNSSLPEAAPLEPSLVDIVPQGIDVGFLARHSQDRALLESLGVNVESPNSSLPDAVPYMASIYKLCST